MKHWNSIFLACLVVVLLSPVVLGTASADSTSINGWTNQGQSGLFDFYVTPNQQVNPTELAMLVNYEDTPIRFEVDEGAKTVYTQTVDPHTSQFLTIPFNDVQTDYKLIISNQGYTLLTLTKSAPGYYLPPLTDDNSWHIAPPVTNNTGLKQYTQSFVDGLVAILTLQVFACVMIAVVIGIMLGSAVKKSVLFFVPKDIISIFVYVWLVSDLIFNWTKFGIGIYYIPFLAGYLLGFFLTHLSYVEAEVLDLGGKARAKQPYVIYSPNEEIGHCIQQQSNKALVKRWLGYHHRLGMDGPLSPELADSTKYPYFPLFRKQILCIEDTATDFKDEPFFFGLINIRVYTTYWRLSNVCKFPKAQWIASSATIIRGRDLIQRLTSDLVKERQTNYMDATHVAADMISRTIDRSTHRAIYDEFNGPIAPLTIPTRTENVMRDITAKVSSPQQTPQDTEPERTEKKKKRNNEIENESEPAMDREDEERNDNNNTNKKRRN